MKKIHVLVNYGGALTGERRILPGVYDEDAPELFGIADYLVENGFARDITPVAPVEVKVVSVEPSDTETAHDEAPAKPSKPSKQK